MAEGKGPTTRPNQSYPRDDSRISPRPSDQSKRRVSLQRQRNSYSKQRRSFVSFVDIGRKNSMYICVTNFVHIKLYIYKAFYISI
jgi:hypothetical protein